MIHFCFHFLILLEALPKGEAILQIVDAVRSILFTHLLEPIPLADSQFIIP